MELNLIGKTELWIQPVRLRRVDLGRVAAVVASVLDLAPEEVLVVDARPGLLVLDILRQTIPAASIAGREQQLLAALAGVEGVGITAATSVHSEGVLGLLALDATGSPGYLERARALGEEVRARVARRALVFASGSEVSGGLVRDTNSPYLCARLTAEGYRARAGGVLPDDADAIAGALRRAGDAGYGLVITTGGVGAEAKDRTIEGLLQVDAGAATAWVVRYEAGRGRHEKAGVRVAVGRVGPGVVVCLPGPHAEVRAALPVLLLALERGHSTAELAEAIAARLRALLRDETRAHNQGRYAHGH